MNHVLKPWQLFLLILDGWINRHQQEVIEYLEAENRVFREKFGKKRIVLNADQGLDKRLIDPGEEVGLTAGEVQCRERLGGMLRYYHRKAA